MKLAALLAQYLYANKRLDLPGIGTFFLDSPIPVDTDAVRHGKTIHLEGVSFKNDPYVRETADLVQFIATESGKIKALAAADLDSHLSLALQFINIGKPFLFEGIGSLSKVNKGGFSFTPGEIIPERMRDQVSPTSEGSDLPAVDTGYKSIFYGKKSKPTGKIPIIAFLVVVGIALAIWGGYTVYKRTASQDTPVTTDSKGLANQTTLLEDTVIQRRDSALPVPAATAPAPITTTPGMIKYVLETSDSPRAFQRYRQLTSYQWAVQMETPDSIRYKLFLLLPTSPSDTSRVLDSLSRLNGRRVYIE